MAEDNKRWTSLTEPKNGVALLGRMVKVEEDSIQMEYIVVDTNQSNVVISSPSIVAQIGKKAEISVGSKTGDIKVSLLVKKTSYIQEK